MNKRLLWAWVPVSFLLLVSVIISDVGLMPFSAANTQPMQYPAKEMLLGAVGESLRAIFTCYLYTQVKGYGSSLRHGIKFGLLTSILIGSVWLLIGYGSFVLKNPSLFLIADSLILFIQGILSGWGLYMIYKAK